MIILTIQGAGKTYAAETIEKVNDIDVADYRDKSVDDYVCALAMAEKAYEPSEKHYVLGNASVEVAEKLLEKGFEVSIYAPFKESLGSDYEGMKERLFGRYVLRKEQTPKNVGWIEKMKKNFDIYCSMQTYSDLWDKYPYKLHFMHMTPMYPYIGDCIKNIL